MPCKMFTIQSTWIHFFRINASYNHFDFPVQIKLKLFGSEEDIHFNLGYFLYADLTSVHYLATNEYVFFDPTCDNCEMTRISKINYVVYFRA